MDAEKVAWWGSLEEIRMAIATAEYLDTHLEKSKELALVCWMIDNLG
jgi:hypothetical protein